MKNKEWKGTSVDLSCAIQVVKYLEDVIGYDDKPILCSVYTAITELLSNIAHHAYTSEFIDSLWKVTVRIQSNDLTSIVIEDYGITIPLSIAEKMDPESNRYETYDDNQLIQEAIYKKNSVFTKGRGHGLQSIIRSVDEGLIKHFGIRSRDGTFQYKTVPSNSELSNTNKSMGTSVEIIIPGVLK